MTKLVSKLFLSVVLLIMVLGFATGVASMVAEIYTIALTTSWFKAGPLYPLVGLLTLMTGVVLAALIALWSAKFRKLFD